MARLTPFIIHPSRDPIAMLFATNRSISQVGGNPVPHTSEQFPLTEVSFDLDENAPSAGVHFGERFDENSYAIIGHSQFLTRLKDHDSKQVLLYIHGFNNLPEDEIFERARNIQELSDEREPRLLTVVPLIWPCDNDTGVLKDYWDDQEAADASDTAFARMLEFFLGWTDHQADSDDPCYKRVNILAHSMGNRVLRGALTKTARRRSVEGLFRNIFMVAADVTNECLERGESGHVITSACRSVVVYHANDDVALRASKVVNLKSAVVSRRLGHTGPERVKKTPANVFSIDCDNFNNTLDYPKGHSYFLVGNRDKYAKCSPVMNHMLSAISTGRVEADPSSRSMTLPINYGA